MNINKIVGYISIAVIVIATLFFTRDALVALLITIIGFFIISLL